MEAVNEWYNGYLITTDKSVLQPDAIHKWLMTESYWSRNLPKETFLVAFENSYSIGALIDGEQVAYARFVTDYATFAYLADVYVRDDHRGRGISKKMMAILMELDWVKKLRRLVLVTLDAHELYRQYGFTPLSNPERYLEIGRPYIYLQSTPEQNESK